MKPAEAKRFNELYQRHLELLKIQGKSRKTIDAYYRAVRRVSEYDRSSGFLSDYNLCVCCQSTVSHLFCLGAL